MAAAIQIKREELKALSQPFKVLVKNGSIDSINTGLATLYAKDGHTTLKSFNEWKKDGFSVKKGSKALLMWGKPITNDKSQEQQQKDEDKKMEFFPIAFLFSNLQVEPDKFHAK